MGNSVRIAAALLSVCRKRDSQSIDNGYKMSFMVDIQKTIVGRLNARFHLPENVDFTLWVCVVQATSPRPDRWPTVYAVIAEKCMVTKQHKSPAR